MPKKPKKPQISFDVSDEQHATWNSLATVRGAKLSAFQTWLEGYFKSAGLEDENVLEAPLTVSSAHRNFSSIGLREIIPDYRTEDYTTMIYCARKLELYVENWTAFFLQHQHEFYLKKRIERNEETTILVPMTTKLGATDLSFSLREHAAINEIVGHAKFVYSPEAGRKIKTKNLVQISGFEAQGTLPPFLLVADDVVIESLEYGTASPPFHALVWSKIANRHDEYARISNLISSQSAHERTVELFRFPNRRDDPDAYAM